MKIAWPFLICLLIGSLSYSFESSAQVGIQTNLLGISGWPMVFPKNYAADIGFEFKLDEKVVVKSSIVYQQGFSRNASNSYSSRLIKQGIRCNAKFYAWPIRNSTLPEGFYHGPYVGAMHGDRYIHVQENVEHRKGMYLFVGYTLGYTLSWHHITLEPHLGLGFSQVSGNLVSENEFLNVDPLIQGLSSCHLQLNVGWRK
jgi:hypothetical protein